MRAGIHIPQFPEPGGIPCQPNQNPQTRHILVPLGRRHERLASLCRHVWSKPIPNGAFRAVSSGVLVSSPEFTFLQLASMLDLIDTALVGMSLCARYRIPKTPEPGPYGLRSCKPVTSVSSISHFCLDVKTANYTSISF